MAHAQGTLLDGRIIVVAGYSGGSAYETSNILLPGIACGTVTPVPTGGTATATPTAGVCTPVPAGWFMKAPITADPGLTRADAAYFSGTGKIYVFGGRPVDSPPGNYNQNIYVYDPGANSWATASTTLTDTRVSNLQAAVLTGPSGPRIYLFGGSPSSGDPDPTPSDIVRVYDPVSGSLTNADPWPQNPTAVPGGGAVFNNKFYLFGGFDPLTSGGITLDTIWEFDPMAAPGSQWSLKSTHMSLDRGYIGTVTIGNYIYLAGGSQWDGSALTNETILERYDPTANTISTMAPIPTGSSNWSAYTDGTKLYAAGGFFPTAIDITYIYDPASNSWTTGPSMPQAVRNYASTQIDNNQFYAIGGYDSASAISNYNQLYTTGLPCLTPTATATSPAATATATSATPQPTSTTGVGTPTTPAGTATATSPAGTATSTPTACTLSFEDVPVTNTFYPFVRCLACKGIINGYPCGGEFEPCNANEDPYFRPNNPVTRGQISKMVSLSAGFNEPVPATQQSFEDVVYGSPFWEYVERLYTRGIVGGYQCGINPSEPCVPPDDRPYFRPNAGATRGQLVKIASESAGFNDAIPADQQTFTDVEPGSTFWLYIERLLANRPDAIAGYPCGGPNEPCDSENRPYFRPNNGVTRGQASKIIANTFFPGCNPPLSPKDSLITTASR
jgi:N-acetylneuraminic acid mutarotase